MVMRTIRGDGDSYDDSLANSQLNQPTDTVRGQLDKFTDFNDPVMKRVQQNALDKASGRGLGNTTIAQGNATGAVIDRAGQFAIKDAELYSNRRTENQRAGVALESTAMSNKANLVVGRERNTTTMSAQRLSNEGALAVAESNSRAQAMQAAADRVAATERTAMQTSASERNNAANNVTSQINTAANNRTSTANSKANNDTAILNNVANNLNREQIAWHARRADGIARENNATQSAWDNYQTGIANIDPNASGTSQQTQFDRLKSSFQARTEFNEGLFN